MSIAFQSFSLLPIALSVHGNIVIAKPAGTVEGDLLVYFAHDEGAAGGSFATLPAGWTLIDEFLIPAANPIGAAAFLIAGPSEPSTYTFQLLSALNKRSLSAILRFSSTIGFPVAPIGAFARLATRTVQGSPVDYTIPSANVAAAKARVLRVLVQFNGPVYADGVFSYLSGPAATEIMDKTGNPNIVSGVAAYLEDAEVGPGATGISVVRFSPPVSTDTYIGWGWTLPLIEATGGSGGTSGAGSVIGPSGQPIRPGDRIERGLDLAPGYRVPVVRGTRLKNPVERMDDPWKALRRIKEDDEKEEEK